ncbi:sigma-54 dependent transcriptional regulator [Gilvimarinus sp. DA14]|uniref:sigma-54-dependent transcriptional regulator n=1 Tax=Gilvimarinus sp. DA14 TaxID=2956798 RepID=UPI0020B7622A|nr:sigma-54 dependent transcriptional regulator [Gilvimarinus sp. DA14]UTF61769.1 sigma-54 dependent transcriptional regulator [Gilvimarinus sp. DA14]
MKNNEPLVLVVDDKPANLDILVDYLSSSGLELAVATDGEQALEVASLRQPELVLLDVMMPGMDGFEVCRRLKKLPQGHDFPIIFMSALGDTDSKVKGFTVGAVDYITKPLQREEVLARITTHLTIRQQQLQLREQNRELLSLNRQLQEQIDRRLEAESALHLAGEQLSAVSEREAAQWGIEAFIGQSSAILDLLEQVRALQSAQNTNVLVLGESGTGKELVSRAIHYGSERRAKPFIAVNCSAIPAELADAEFFGHTKGAYTGAVADRAGFFVRADGGTLFLDEIGDMPLPLQAKLLRVLEDGLVTPVGGKNSRRVNVRIVAATNAELSDRVSSGEFRKDLYFRLAGYQITLPPLRERAVDIPLLVQYFAEQLCAQMGRENVEIDAEALVQLRAYHYPGNVRELKNLIEYALIASRGQNIGVRHLHFLEPVAQVASEPTDKQTIQVRAAQGCDEDRIVAQLEERGRIDNAEVQALLGVDHHRASYLLKKLHRDGRLQRCGERRWSYYTLA